MKNLFFALAFILVGTFANVNAVEPVFPDYFEVEDNKETKGLLIFENQKHSLVVSNLEPAYFCSATVTVGENTGHGTGSSNVSQADACQAAHDNAYRAASGGYMSFWFM